MVQLVFFCPIRHCASAGNININSVETGNSTAKLLDNTVCSELNQQRLLTCGDVFLDEQRRIIVNIENLNPQLQHRHILRNRVTLVELSHRWVKIPVSGILSFSFSENGLIWWSIMI